MNGFLLVDKPVGMTSHDVVAKARSLLKFKKIGHLGTLDPLASGLIVLVLGKATKLTQFLIEHDKVYRFGIILGAETATHDSESPLITYSGVPDISFGEIDDTIHRFLGGYFQTPPIYSALKINGTKLCNIARRQKTDLNEAESRLPSRKVFIYSLEPERFNMPYVQFKARVSSGTYIRALGRDIGRDLGCGAYVCLLRRLSVGDFLIEDAISLEGADPDEARSRIIPIAGGVKDFPIIRVGEATEQKIRNGISVDLGEDGIETAGRIVALQGKTPVLVVSKNNEELCIGECRDGRIFVLRGLWQ